MTRFARAKGSKASNERQPEVATEWHVMKQQLIENRNKTEEPPISSNTEVNVNRQPVAVKEEKNIQWSDFPNTNPIKASVETTQPPKLKKMKKKRVKDESPKEETEKVENKPTDCETEEKKNNNEEKRFKKRQRGKKRQLEEEASTEVDDQETSKPQNDDEKRVKKRQRGKKRKLEEKTSTEVDDQETNNPQNDDKSDKFNSNGMKNNKKKFKSDDFKRRKPQSTENFIGIHGTTIEIMYFDRFPVKKEDYLRLIQLRKDLIKKGVPRSAIEVTMKLERRRAEKALTNEKKKVCFNCRKSGHNISDCPELRDGPNPEMTATGICFKCGSTQHIAVQCKVTKGDSFQFATCFICKEVGHISRQCPDNTRGIYPRGGSCNLCGDVTHIKINCPQFQAEKQESTIYAEVIGGDVESLGDENKKVVRAPPTKQARHIKF